MKTDTIPQEDEKNETFKINLKGINCKGKNKSIAATIPDKKLKPLTERTSLHNHYATNNPSKTNTSKHLMHEHTKSNYHFPCTHTKKKQDEKQMNVKQSRKPQKGIL